MCGGAMYRLACSWSSAGDQRLSAIPDGDGFDARVGQQDRPAVAVAQPRNRTTHAHRGRARQDGRNMVKVVAPIKPSR